MESKFLMTSLSVLCISVLMFCSCKREESDDKQEVYYHLELTAEPEEGGNISLPSGDHPAGTVVSIEAVPAAGYVFEGWRGSISGAANPLTLTMDSDKSLTAVFVKNKYAFNLTIVGPGVVDEYLVEETRTTVEYGTKILLKAIPDAKGSVFKGWSGDLSGNEQEVLVEMGQSLNITATFEQNNKTYPLPDLTLPSSMHKELYYGEDFTAFSMIPTFFLPVDYNRDGYLDVVVCDSDFSMEKRNFLRFYKRMKDGSYEIDDVNSNRFEGLIYGPKNSFYGDFNGDGITDICFVGHGIDEYPWPGESPIILFGSGSGAFTMERLTQAKGYFHGSCVGDFDNDGDLDIFLLDHSSNSCFLINDGNGQFAKVPVFYDSSVLNGGTYTAAMYDLNHDGFLDLFIGGHEHEDNNWENLYRYTNTTRVFWGDGKSFDGDNLSKLPRFKDGYGVILDYLF